MNKKIISLYFCPFLLLRADWCGLRSWSALPMRCFRSSRSSRSSRSPAPALLRFPPTGTASDMGHRTSDMGSHQVQLDGRCVPPVLPPAQQRVRRRLADRLHHGRRALHLRLRPDHRLPGPGRGMAGMPASTSFLIISDPFPRISPRQATPHAPGARHALFRV